MSYDLTPSDDLRQIMDAAGAVLAAEYPLSRLRDPARADDLGALADFGAFVLALPEDRGGAGFTLLDEAHLHAAMGRHLLTPGTIAQAIAARTGADGTVCAGVAASGGWLLFEPAGAVAALVRDGADFRLADLAGQASEPVAAMGHGRPMARLAPVLAPALPAGLAQVARLLICAQLLGVASGARDLAVEYAKVREQFGRPIGSFQAIKHHAANMAIRAEMLSSLLDVAAIALRDGHPDAPFQLAALARLAPGIALENARIGIQMHGGIGFSAEADAHLFVKQAHVLGQLLGPSDILHLPAPLTPHP